MDQDGIESYSNWKEDKMPPGVKDIWLDGDNAEKKLDEWNQQRPGYMEGTQTQIVALNTGRFGNAIEFMEDGEHENDIIELIGKDEWDAFWKLRDIYFNTKMTPADWRGSPERIHFYEIVGKVAQHPPFEKFIMRGVDVPVENETVH